MDNKKGASAIIWILGVAILVLVIVFATNYVQKEAKQRNSEDIKTEMLQVQAKAKVVLEKYHVDKNNGLKGEKMEDISLESLYNITNIGDYYKWNKDTLKEVGFIETVLKEGDYYLVNYELEEVIYSIGYKAEDGNTYYKLSEIKNIK